MPSPHGTVFAGQGAAMRAEPAAADAARGMRQRIDENRTCCPTLQPTNDAIYATNEMPGYAVRLGAVASTLRCLAVRCGPCSGLAPCVHASSTICLNVVVPASPVPLRRRSRVSRVLLARRAHGDISSLLVKNVRADRPSLDAQRGSSRIAHK